MKLKMLFLLLTGIVLTTSCKETPKAPKTDTSTPLETSNAKVYYNGDIITMEGDTPEYVEAIVVKDGKIAFTGKSDEAMTVAGPGHKMINLNGHTLLPGFMDGHGHAWNAGFQAVSANLLPAPDGEGKSIDDIIRLLNDWKANNTDAISKYGAIVGFGYDDSQLKEKRHPTADDLDKVSTEVPVFIIHQSGHLASTNHKGLEAAGYTEGVQDPAGGSIRREEGTDIPNGVLEEMASFIPLIKFMSTLDTKANELIAKAGIDAYLKFGYTTVQEGRATSDNCETWKTLASRNELPVDVAAYPDIQSQMDYMLANGASDNYTNHYRIAGVKLSLDGSPQGKTAWLTQPYVVPPTGKSKDYKGYPAIKEDTEVTRFIDSAYAHNWQILTHCNGDAAGDQLIKAVTKATETYGKEDRRPVMIHSQTVRFDQLDKMKDLGMYPSFFSMHTYYWGDWHRDETLGKERAYKISPTATALKKGMIFTEHHDAPVALPSSIMILHTTVNRVSRSGDIIGPHERVSPYIGLCSLTKWAAHQYFEENTKGTLKAGKLADLVILDQNPLKIDPMSIKDITVLETIKEGNTVYKK
ncbi:amidohydrolase [Mangrovimonas sp. YM274]|uniref:amidohydrolase n=1 Tax=Mangrovimonas sp. YM274 TaxID=3070660 RepID=UPI0027DB0378|nr:amidohydrolase [Mangrovimonas sp. YM274]WMI67464.1 amidohydrolase family protein [Mangrovimonas sp. YM274]